MLSEDIWVYIASYYLDSCDTSNLSRTCWSLRRFLLPLVFREQTFEGFNYYSTQSFLDSFSHFSKIKRRILFYSQHPQIATFIQKLEIRNWIHTYVYPKLENTTEPRQQRLVRQDPLAENLMDMHREMVSYCTVLYADLLQMITTLPNLSILAFREGKITHGQQYSRFWEPAVTITNPLRSYNFLEFARGSQCAWKLALPEVFTDGSVARYGYPPWQRYFREIIQSPFLKLTSARLLGDFLATLPTPLLQKFAGIRNLGIIFCANRNLESKLSENIQTIVGAGNALRTLAIVPYRSQSMILQSALPDLPNLDKYCGPAELLRALDLKNHLTSLSLIDSKWDVVAPILKDLPVTCRERIRRLDLSWFAFLSRNDLSEAAIIWPRVEDLTLWHRGKSEEMVCQFAPDSSSSPTIDRFSPLYHNFSYSFLHFLACENFVFWDVWISDRQVFLSI